MPQRLPVSMLGYIAANLAVIIFACKTTKSLRCRSGRASSGIRLWRGW